MLSPGRATFVLIGFDEFKAIHRRAMSPAELSAGTQRQHLCSHKHGSCHPVSGENWSSLSAARRGTESQDLGFGSGLHSRQPFLQREPQTALFLALPQQGGGLGNRQTPGLTAWQNQKMLRGPLGSHQTLLPASCVPLSRKPFHAHPPT